MNKLDQTKISILREASRTLNTVSKVKQENEEFVKCKRSYSHPEAVRTLYLRALDSLIDDGVMNLVLTNEYLDLYEVNPEAAMAPVAPAATPDELLTRLRAAY